MFIPLMFFHLKPTSDNIIVNCILLYLNDLFLYKYYETCFIIINKFEKHMWVYYLLHFMHKWEYNVFKLKSLGFSLSNNE